jgi:acyl-CoA reductase-like NAD-dependent aldehyde dehydrogenase
MAEKGVAENSRIKEYKHFVGGEWALRGKRQALRRLSALRPCALCARCGLRSTRSKARRRGCANAFPAWSQTAPAERARAAEFVKRRRADIAKSLALGEALETNVPGAHSIGVRRPLGVVACFTPWNGANSWRAVLSAVAAGNAVIVKPSEFAPISAGLILAEIIEKAGFPTGVINVVTHAPGLFEGQIYQPTILSNVPLDIALANEETFRPVVVVEVVDTPKQAVEAANRTLYGLTSSILAGDTYRAFELAPRVLAGIVNINSPTVNDEIHAPMGHVRDSGWGRTSPDSERVMFGERFID